MRALVGPVGHAEIARRAADGPCREDGADVVILIFGLEVCALLVERTVLDGDVLAVLVGLRRGVEREYVGQLDTDRRAEADARQPEVVLGAGADADRAVVRDGNAFQRAAACGRGVDAERSRLVGDQRETVVVGGLHRQPVHYLHAVERVPLFDVHLRINAHVHRFVYARHQLLVRDGRGVEDHLRRFGASGPVIGNGFQLHDAVLGAAADDGPFQVYFEFFADVVVMDVVEPERDARAGFGTPLQGDAVLEVIVVLYARYDGAAHLHLVGHRVVALGGERLEVGDGDVAFAAAAPCVTVVRP